MFIVKEETKDVTGTFVCVKFDTKTVDMLMDFVRLCNIENPLDSDDLHATVLYSKEKDLTELKSSPVNLYRMVSKVCGADIFQNSDGTNALVLKLKSPHITARHEYLRSKYDVQHTFLEFCPHVTLTYDFKGDVNDINRKLSYFNDKCLVADREIVEDLK